MADAGARVLVVDDEAAVGRAVVDMLRAASIPSAWVESAADALSRLAFGNYELVLTDLRMPKVGGLELLRAIAELDPALPVVLVCEAGEPEAAVEAVRAGAFDLLWKPVEPTKLVEVVQRAFVIRAKAVRERERATEERARLQRRSALLSVLFQAGSDGVLTWDADGRLVDVSPSVATLTGIELGDDLVGAQLFEREPFGGALEDRVAALARQPGTQTRVEVVVRTREGPAPARLTLTVCELPPAENGEQSVCWVVGLLQPPRREDLRDRLRRTDRLATAAMLSSGAAHEIKNDLGPLLACLTMLEDIANEDPELREVFVAARECVRRIETGVERILAPLRPQRPRLRPLQIGPLVHDSVSFVRRADYQRNLTIELSIDDELPPIIARPDDIHQIVVNLVTNAAEAGLTSSERGRASHIRVRVFGHIVTDRVVLEVVDDGPGIPPDLRARVFEPFFTTRGERGTGLGLTVVHDLVRELGGDLTIVSTPAIEGTCVRVLLPAARTSTSSPSGPESERLLT